MTNPDNVGGLPELPEPRFITQLGNEAYSASQMRAYGELCRAAPAGGDVTHDNEVHAKAIDELLRRKGDCYDFTTEEWVALVHGAEALRRLPTVVVAAPAGGDVPFDTVRSVCRALTRLGHHTPESQEEQAARAVELVNTLCREVQSHFDSLGSAPAGSGEVEGIAASLEQIAEYDWILTSERLDEDCRIVLHQAAALLRKLQHGAE